MLSRDFIRRFAIAGPPDHCVKRLLELVEAGLLSSEDVRRFTFENPVQLFARANPAFFEGTAVEESARELLQRPR